MFRCVDATFPHGERKGIAASQPSSLLQNQYKYHFHLRAGWGGFVVRAPVVCIREFVFAAFFSLFSPSSSLAGTPVFLQDHAETRLLAASSTANVTSVTAVTMVRHPTYRPAKFVARALSLSLLQYYAVPTPLALSGGGSVVHACLSTMLPVCPNAARPGAFIIAV